MQCVVGRYFAECFNEHNGLMADSIISGPMHMFTVCYLRTHSTRCRGPFRACVGYRCVEGRWWLNIGGLGGLIYDLLYGVVIGSGMSALDGGSGVGVTGVEYVVNCCVGGWGTWIGASCTDAGCGIFFVLGTGGDDAAVSKIVARFWVPWGDMNWLMLWTVAKAFCAHLITH